VFGLGRGLRGPVRKLPCSASPMGYEQELHATPRAVPSARSASKIDSLKRTHVSGTWLTVDFNEIGASGEGTSIVPCFFAHQLKDIAQPYRTHVRNPAR